MNRIHHEYTLGAAQAVTTSNRQLFQDLLQQHRRIVFKVASTYCSQPADRDDLAQEIAVQLWRSFAAYEPARSFSTWMYRIALNVAISAFRRRKQDQVHTEALDERHDVADLYGQESFEQQEQLAALYGFIDQLDPLNRALLLLYLDERSQGEIAEILGITETNVATKIGRLKQRLRDGIAQSPAN